MLFSFVRLSLLIIGFSFFSLFARSSQISKKSSVSSSFQIKPNKTVEDYINESEDALNSSLNHALEYAQTALLLSKERNKPLLNFNANNQVAKVFFYLGVFDQAAKYWLMCDSIAEQINDHYLKAKSNFQLSALYIALEDYKTAEKYIKLAKSFFDKQLNKGDLIPKQQLILNNLAVIYQKIGKSDLAEEYFHDAIEFAKAHELFAQLKTSLSAFSSFLISQNRYVEAKEAIQKLQVVNSSNEYSQQLEATNLIKLYRIEKNISLDYESDSLLFKGYTLAKRSNSISLMKEYTQEIFQLERNRENLVKALEYRELFEELLKQEEHEKALNILHIQEIKKEFKDREDAIRLSVKKTTRKISTIIILLILITAIIFYLLIWKIKQIKKIKKEKEKTEMINNKALIKNHELTNKLDEKRKILATEKLKQINQSKKLMTALQKLEQKKDSFANIDFNIKEILKECESDEDWVAFDIRFNKINNDFYQKLEHIHPNLSINEKRLCAFLKLEMTSKEIIKITGQSVRAVEIARTRLRKKLGLTQKSIRLTTFLKEL